MFADASEVCRESLATVLEMPPATREDPTAAIDDLTISITTVPQGTGEEQNATEDLTEAQEDAGQFSPLPTMLNKLSDRAAKDPMSAESSTFAHKGKEPPSLLYPSPELYLAQVNSEALVDPANFFITIQESIPHMTGTNAPIQQRIDAVVADRPH